MSSLSVHYNGGSGSKTGFGDFLKKCYAAGSPVKIIYSVDGDIQPDIVNNSPTTKWVYRYQTAEFNRLPDGFFTGDPAANCVNWMTQIKDSSGNTLVKNWALNPADWYDPLNEPVPDIPEKAQWLNTWMLTALEIANSYGYKLAMFSMATGSPPIDMWQYLLPSIRRGKQLGAIISIHAYWSGDPSLDTNNALRYRDIWKVLTPDAQVPFVISEASSGNGYATTYSGQAWVNDMAKYDVELMKDPYVLGACGYQLGGNESNLQPALSLYGDYVAATPTEVIVIGEPRVQYARTVNVVPANTTDARFAEISAICWSRSKQTVTGSYDDAGIGDLTNKTAVLWDIPSNQQQTFIDWFNQYYPGTIVKFDGDQTPK